MNKRKLAILSLILPMILGTQAQANPWKNALKKAGYTGAAVLAVYAGYKAAQAYGLFGQPEQAPIQNPFNKTTQELLEKSQNEKIQAREAHGALKKQAQKDAQAAELKIASLQTQEAATHGLLAAKAQETELLRKHNATKEAELEQLAALNTDLLKELSQIATPIAKPTLPVTIVTSPATSVLPEQEETEPIFDLTNEYVKVLKTNAINSGTMINIARQAFDNIASFLTEKYDNDQTLIDFGTTYGVIRQCQQVMQDFNQLLKDNNYDFSNPDVLKQAEHALQLLYAGCKSVNTSLPMFRTKIADKATRTTAEWFKGKEAQILEEFDSFKLSFEQRLQQLQPIKNNSLTQ